MEYLWLFMWWLSFCALHSLFASDWWKSRVRGLLKQYFIYYRFLYVVFAAVHLGGVLFYQFSIEPMPLWKTIWIAVVAAAPFITAGLAIMIASIYKYFFHLSGISVFSDRPASTGIFQDGLHRYVRHPLYAGTLLLVWSLFIVFPLLSNLIACVMITVYTIAGIKLEEEKLLAEKGNLYKEYIAEVPMLIPGRRRRLIS